MCEQVTGSKNEDQILNAIEVYTDQRPELAHRAINQLFDIARIQHCGQLLRALKVTHTLMILLYWSKVMCAEWVFTDSCVCAAGYYGPEDS